MIGAADAAKSGVVGSVWIFFDGGNRSEQFHHIIKIIGRWYGRMANVMASSWMGAENRSIEEAARMVKI